MILPSSWAGTECVSTASGRNVTVSSTFFPADFEADFSVVSPHPIYGSEPRALHSGECGMSGRGVRLPYTMLLEEDTGDRPRMGKRQI